jgi:hypothetical protein
LEDVRVDERILKWILKKHSNMGWGCFIWLRKRKSGGLLEHSHELLGSIKYREFLTGY